jgi:SpoVK/Ycf46/Vps4 family AAA+-type ATPase
MRPLPEITVEEAVSELDQMIGLGPVKEQVRSIAATVEAARRRAIAGVHTQKPMRHFVFLGPPGTGKTSVVAILAKILYSFGLLYTPTVVQARRADLVGEYPGASRIKTNKLVDASLGGVLFIDEADRLMNKSRGHDDTFGLEAVQALARRAEIDRENLTIILAGHEKQMETFLESNQIMASSFPNRISFSSYSPPELLAMAESRLDRRREVLHVDACAALWRILDDVGRRGLTDELGNGWFVRNLVEKTGQARDLRVMSSPAEPTPAALVTIQGVDLQRAYAELTSNLRGYGDSPTPESAVGELDELVGLESPKQQIREISSQVRVAQLRAQRGLTSQPSIRHFAFVGPTGTGKTMVARIFGHIFAALGLTLRPEVVQIEGAEFVGQDLSTTVIKANRLIDSALGGILFIHRADLIDKTEHTDADVLAAEAVKTLIERGQDDRDRLVIILADQPVDMDHLLGSNRALASMFRTRIQFPRYSAIELSRIARLMTEQLGDRFDATALQVLDDVFSDVAAMGRLDQLGNGRFARSLVERACSYRDQRIVRLGEAVTAGDLSTITAGDVKTAYQELADR